MHSTTCHAIDGSRVPSEWKGSYLCIPLIAGRLSQIRFVVTSSHANLIGSCDLGSTFLVTSDLRSTVAAIGGYGCVWSDLWVERLLL